MSERKTINFFHLFLYLTFAVVFFCLYHVGNFGEPLGLCLLYAMLAVELSPVISGILYALPVLPDAQPLLFILYLTQACLLGLGFFLHRKRQNPKNKIELFPLIALSLSLGIFIAFAPFDGYPDIFFFTLKNNALTQKILLSALFFLLSASFSVALKALLQKFLKCRLYPNELTFCLLFFTVIGVGVCKFFSVNAYMGISFFVLLVFAYVTKDASTMLCAFVLSLPPFLCGNLSTARFFLYGILITVFIKSGKLAAVCALLLAFFAYGYFDGLYAYSTAQLTASLLSILLPCLLFILTPTSLLRILENKLIFYKEKHLSRVAINRNRMSVGEKLFEISSVFREIETAFSSLGSSEAEESAKEYIRGCILNEVCKNCAQKRICLHKNMPKELDKLIHVGCLKGKASVIDLPKPLAETCVSQSDVLFCLNRQLVDYQKYMLEAENAAAGRALLANQAQGVSEILKNLALEQSEPLQIYTDKERALHTALLNVGIVCSEILVYGEKENFTVSLTTFQRADVKKISAVVTHVCNMPMLVSERLALGEDKYCCILHKKPKYDAAFGVATATKKGESDCGDSHAVLKIDERKFLVALSDGMGSGAYARKISETTLSLLESFYRAKMPSDLVLSTVNKLLAFNKEETFACVDIGVVDLDNGNVDVVKIGSPMGFILSGTTVKVLESGSLPLGILDAVRPDTANYTLSENDVLLFLSDGITDAFSSTGDLLEILKTLPVGNPQQMADTLLQKAIASYGGAPKDDMTVLAVRLFLGFDL